MSTDRTLAALRAIIAGEIQSLKYAAQYEYTIKAINGQKPDQTFDLDPVNAAVGLPGLTKIPIDREMAGMTGLPTVGFTCRVIFLNRDTSLPRVVGWDHIGKTPIARLGDRCSINWPQQTAILAGVGSLPILRPGFTGTLITLEPNIDGFITVGSPVAFSG